MYKIQFLPSARNDLLETAEYIASELGNERAAVRLAEKILKGTEILAEFPYSYPVYTPIRPLKYEYRKLTVENYLVFYTVDEKDKTVTVMRVVYARRNVAKIL